MMKSQPAKLLFILASAPLFTIVLSPIASSFQIFIFGSWDPLFGRSGTLIAQFMLLLYFVLLPITLGWSILVAISWPKLRHWHLLRNSVISGVAAVVVMLLMWQEGWALEQIGRTADLLFGVAGEYVFCIVLVILPALASASFIGAFVLLDNRAHM